MQFINLHVLVKRLKYAKTPVQTLFLIFVSFTFKSSFNPCYKKRRRSHSDSKHSCSPI